MSAASVVFAAAAGALLAFSVEKGGDACAPFLLAAAACVQLRLLCNMLDGLLAVGLGSPAGDIWNDLPDRIGSSHRVAHRNLDLMGAGHGGMLDRIDSLCFAAPVFFHLTRYFFTP